MMKQILSRIVWISLIIILGVTILPRVVSNALLNLGHLMAVQISIENNKSLDDVNKVVNRLLISPSILPISKYKTTQTLWAAEVYSASQQWDQARLTYRNYRSSGGDINMAMTRLRGLARLRGWCINNNDHIIDLAKELTTEVQAFKFLGDVCISNDNLDAAIEAYRNAYMMSTTSDISSTLAWLLFGRSERIKDSAPDSSFADLDEVIRILEFIPPDEFNTRDYYILAWSYWQFNRFNDSIGAYQDCLNKGIVDRYTYSCAINLGHIYSSWLPQTEQDLMLANEYYQTAQRLAFDDFSLLEVFESLGQISLRMNKPALARDYFIESLHIESKCIQCRLGLAQSLERLGQFKTAVQQYQQVLQLAPDEPNALEALEELKGH